MYGLKEKSSAQRDDKDVDLRRTLIAHEGINKVELKPLVLTLYHPKWAAFRLRRGGQKLHTFREREEEESEKGTDSRCSGGQERRGQRDRTIDTIEGGKRELVSRQP